MNRISTISQRLADDIVRKQLLELLPSEVLREVEKFGTSDQVGVLEALQNRKQWYRSFDIHRGGDMARSGFEKGKLLAINDRIVTKSSEGIWGEDIVKVNRKWDLHGNHIELGEYSKQANPLD